VTSTPAGTFTRRSAAGFIGVLAAGTAFGVLLVLVRLQWSPLDRLDGDVAVRLNRSIAPHPALVGALRLVTTFGGRSLLFWFITLGATTAFLLIRRQVPLALYLLVTGMGALALDPLLKVLVGRLRPVVPLTLDVAPGNSFPSGHALNATACYGALLLVFLPTIPARLRKPVIWAAVALVAAVGFSRIALGVHFLSDVVGGCLLGIAWLSITTYAFRHWRRASGQPLAPLWEGLAPEAAADLKAAYILPVRHPWLAAAWLAIAWVLLVEIFAGIGQTIVRHPAAFAFDEAIPRWLAAHRTPTLDSLSALFSRAGDTHSILAVGLIIGPLALAYVRRWRPVVFLVVVMVGEVTLFLAIAALVGRDRPAVPRLETYLPTSSFPSGHTAATTCLYAALAVIVAPRVRPPWKQAVIAVAVLMPTLIALSRMYRGVHHPLDVSAGALLGLIWLGVVALAVRPNHDLPRARVRRLPVDVPALAPVGAPAVEGPQPSAVVANPTKVAHPVAQRAAVDSALTASGWPPPAWLETTPEDPGCGQARQAVHDGATVVFAAGGDGTVRACASALAGTGVGLAVLPMGTGNLLARNVNLPTHLPDAIATATGHGRRAVDIGVVEDRCFTVMAGMGLDADMIHDAPEQLKARLGWPAYAVAAARHLCQAPMHVTITVDGSSPVTRRARMVLIGNVGQLQGGLRVLPQARPDDGVLDVAVFAPITRRGWFPLAWALLRRRRSAANVETFRGRDIDIVSDTEQPRELDGDLIEPSDRLSATVRPGALWLCTPPSPRLQVR
jgi:undecaprenyl-diphosphatase